MFLCLEMSSVKRTEGHLLVSRVWWGGRRSCSVEEPQHEEPAVGTTQQAQKAAHAQWILPLQGQSFSYLRMLSAFHSHPIEFMK